MRKSGFYRIRPKCQAPLCPIGIEISTKAHKIEGRVEFYLDKNSFLIRIFLIETKYNRFQIKEIQKIHKVFLKGIIAFET